tara:strand:+ start:124 stop:498 length:375 start_codon:yes stop_codon:yes gene_type:complete
MKILLVDDSKTMRNIWKKVVSTFEPDAEIFEAGDGLEGLAVFSEQSNIDLALVDWNMPNMNGLEMVTKVRETNKDTVIIMCTTEAEKPRIIEAIKAGINNYVIKPFTPDAFKEKIQETMAKANA